MLGMFLLVAAHATTVADLSWMAGCWQTTFTEECWLPPRDGLMVGMGRTVRAGRPPSWEYLRIEVDGGQVMYVASPNGQATIHFRLVEASSSHVVFANPAHDFPQTITYRRHNATMQAIIEGVRDGKPARTSWTLSPRAL